MDQCFKCMTWRDHKTCDICGPRSVAEGDAYRDGVWHGIQGTIIVAAVIVFGFLFTKLAFAAETLPSVSPPTDWTGVVVVSVIGALIVAIVGYIINIKRTAGLQFGEAEFERIANLLHAKMNPPAVTFTMPTPLVYDGVTFADDVKLQEYKAAKEIIETYKGKS